MEGVKITIEEWAGDNGISLSEEQIEELADAVDTAYEMSRPCGYGIDQIIHQDYKEQRRLKDQIDMLVRYLESKGYNVIVYDDKIIRHYMVNNGDRSYSEHEVFE